MATKPLCSIDACRKPARTRGLCAIHYNRLWRKGNAGESDPILPRGAPLEWLLEQSTYRGDDCLFWPYQRNNEGYATVSKGGKKRSASRMMCELVHGKPYSRDADTAHSCGNGHLACMTPAHLSWKTRAGNMQDAIVHGTTTRGTKNAQSALTEEDVRAIRALKGRMMYKDIAPVFGVSPSAVGLIMRRERWAWLE